MSGTFVDTSAIYAAYAVDDPRHHDAVGYFDEVGDDRLVTHAAVIAEVTVLLDRRLGTEATRDFLDRLLPTIAVFHGTELTFQRALAAFGAGTGRRRPSLTDRLAFETIRELELDAAFAFDDHFVDAGIRVVPSPQGAVPG